MKRAEKIDRVHELENDLRRATVAVLAEYRGLTAGQLDRFRRAVRAAEGRCRVAKNTLARRAVEASRYEKLGPMLQGPLALILGFKDPVVVAKLTVRFAEEAPKLAIKGAVLDGLVLPPSEVKALATLPSREVVLAQLLGLVQGAQELDRRHLQEAQELRTLNEPAARLARLVDRIGKRAQPGVSDASAAS